MRALLFILIAALGLSVGGSYGLSHLSSKLAEQKLNQAFQSISPLPLPQADKQYGRLSYRDITLDQDEFSTISTLSLRYIPWRFLLFKEAQSLKLSNLQLTGNMSEPHAFHIAGIPHPYTLLALTQWNIKQIDLDQGEIALLNPVMGGISLQFDLNLQRDHMKRMALTGQISSKQRKFILDSRLSGYIEPNGLWRIVLDVENARLELPNIKTSRIHGTLKMFTDTNQKPAVLGEFRAGGLELHGLPWHNAAITIQGQPQSYEFFMGAKSTGQGDIELSLSHQKQNALSGTMYAQTTKGLVEYLNRYDALSKKQKIFTEFAQEEPVYIEFKLSEDDKNILNYNIRNNQKNIDKKGKIVIK